MAWIKSKMPDGTERIETEKEYIERKSSKYIVIIISILAVLGWGISKCDDDTDKSLPSAETEQFITENPITITNRSISETQDKSSLGLEKETSTATQDKKQITEIIPEASEELTANKNIQDAVNKVNQLYKFALDSIKEGDIEDAKVRLEEIKGIQAQMPRKVNRIEERVKHLEKKLKK